MNFSTLHTAQQQAMITLTSFFTENGPTQGKKKKIKIKRSLVALLLQILCSVVYIVKIVKTERSESFGNVS